MEDNTDNQHMCFQLQQLPGPALDLVLKQLDPCSRACTAVTCSQLSRAVPASITDLVVQVNDSSGTIESLMAWLDRYSTANITQCSIASGCAVHPSQYAWLCRLPCPQLHQLSLSCLKLQLEPTDGSPGVLHDCTGLTALDTECCEVQAITAAFAAITALSQLRSLSLALHEPAGSADRGQTEPDGPVSENLQRLSQLTRLYYRCGWQPNAEWQRLGHLSVLVNLQDLTLPCLPDEGLPGGLPSQLTKLTALEVHYDTGRNAAQQLQHLGSLTALQKLVLDFCDFDYAYGAPENLQAGDLAGIQQLSQLTSLQLSSFSLDLSNDSIYRDGPISQRWRGLI